MKKMLALLIALLILALPALAEPMSYLDYTDDILEDGSLIYYFPELSLQLPAEWRGKVMALREENGTSFYQKASYEKYQAEGLDGGGFLFMLGVSVNGSFSQLPAFEYLGYSEESSLNYYLMLPTDYPAYMDDAIRGEYDAMSGQISYVVAHAQLYGKSATSTDAGQDENRAADGNQGVTLEQARYHFEHSTMPRFFYEAPENMLRVVAESGIYRLWTALADENGVEYPYTEGDYGLNRYVADDGTEFMQIIMPKPEANALCYRVYLVFNPGTGKAGYYTVEYDNLLGESAFLCGWTEAREHVNYGGAAIVDAGDADYATALADEAAQVAALAGASTTFTLEKTDAQDTPASGSDTVEDAGNLSLIECPELGFTTMADPAYSWDYQEGTGITVYTEEAGRIPYVIVWRSEDLIGEPAEYIREQYTPHIQKQYGDDLVSYVEYETYDIGGRQLPAGVYTYRLQGYLIDLIRIYDSTGARTAAFTAKYIQGAGEPTLAALDAAIRYFKAG